MKMNNNSARNYGGKCPTSRVLVRAYSGPRHSFCQKGFIRRVLVLYGSSMPYKTMVYLQSNCYVVENTHRFD